MRNKLKGILGIHPPYLDSLVTPSGRPADSPVRMSFRHDGAVPTCLVDDLKGGKSISDNSVAVHPMEGTVFYDGYYRSIFSTQRFIEDLNTAEADARIIAHLILCDSPGGEVFGCHEAHLAVRACKKPVIAVCREIMASAAYWICSAADKVYASSIFSEVGSIGVMARFVDDSGWMEQNGFREISVYASGSDRKNKDVEEVLDGKTVDYAKKFLDPVLAVMLPDIMSSRKGIKENSDILRGEIVYAQADIQLEFGLTDGIKPVEDCIEEAARLGNRLDDFNQLIISTL